MKLIKETARSLRLVKSHGRPGVIERETPTSAPELEIIVPSNATAQRAGFSPELCETIRVIRHDVLATLRQVPAFVSAAQKMASEGCLYRVLVSEEHVHLLREGADGIVNPFLRDAQGRFVENVDLIRVPPDFAGSIAAIAINAALGEISAKLDIFATTVENLTELMRVANLGALQGAIDALQIARQLRDADRRRKQMLDACQEIVVQLGVIAGQMAAHVKEMPSENTGFWTGWDGDRIATAEKAHARVRDDFAVLLGGYNGPWPPTSSSASLRRRRRLSPSSATELIHGQGWQQIARGFCLTRMRGKGPNGYSRTFLSVNRPLKPGSKRSLEVFDRH